MPTRRYFLKNSAIAVAGLGLMPSFLARAAATNTERRKNKVLIAIFQRGAVDGLNMVVPFGERAYYDMRPSISVPAPSAGAVEAAINLDGFFGLHPALRPFQPLYAQGRLAIVHAAGSPDSTRSHFDAQDFMETGTPGRKGTTDGWLNRCLATQKEPDATPFRAVSMTAALPRSLRGPAPAVAMASVSEFQVRSGEGAFQQLYGNGGADIVSGMGREMLEAIDFLKRANPEQYQPAAGADYPRGPLGNSLRQIAQLIKADVGLEVAFTDVGGWDTHVNQGGAIGQLANRLGDFAQAIAALNADLGDRMEDVVILTMSEFGRTAAENGNRGTDHGHANAMFVLGGRVQGGKVYGKWPGLAREQLNEARDLALTTDFRDVFGELIYGHLGNRNLAAVFPGFAASPRNFRGLLKT